MISLVNCNSPLVWDETMLGALKVYARANQAVVVAPFVLAGANTPASAMGALAQLNAEALAGIAFAQLCRPGAPMIYGHFLAAVSMKSGAPMAGTPELAFLNYAIGQLARKYRLPLRSSGMLCGAKTVDAQAAYELVQTMWPVFLAGANYVMHAAGWMEAGLAASFAKFVLDAEQIEMFYRFGQGPQFDDFEEALAAVREIGPGGHYLGTEHTQSHFQTRVLHARARRQQQLRAVAAGRLQGRHRARARDRAPHARRLRAAAARPRDRRGAFGLHPRARGRPAGQHGVDTRASRELIAPHRRSRNSSTLSPACRMIARSVPGGSRRGASEPPDAPEAG